MLYLCDCKARCVFKLDVQILNLSLKCQTELQLCGVRERVGLC